jgi:hypothetical protein
MTVKPNASPSNTPCPRRSTRSPSDRKRARNRPRPHRRISLDAELARQIAELANITIEPDRRLLPPETLI